MIMQQILLIHQIQLVQREIGRERRVPYFESSFMEMKEEREEETAESQGVVGDA
jgi:hypothetical protein